MGEIVFYFRWTARSCRVTLGDNYAELPLCLHGLEIKYWLSGLTTDTGASAISLKNQNQPIGWAHLAKANMPVHQIAILKIMLNYIWPKKLSTPYIELGRPIKDGIDTLRPYGLVVEERDGKEHLFRVATPKFDLGIYEDKGIVAAVWFNDPLGRLWPKGKALKLKLYLERYGCLQDWELRLDNGWMYYHFNDQAGLTLVHGLHKDVVRINLIKKV